jgi:hypothetical protein
MSATETPLKEPEAWHHKEARNTILYHSDCADVNWPLKTLAFLFNQINQMIVQTQHYKEGCNNKRELMMGGRRI